jgi:hypothetical protein
MLDSLECRELVAKCSRGDRNDHLTADINSNEEQMGSTPFGEANPATWTGLAAPQHIEMDRGSDGRVRVNGRT